MNRDTVRVYAGMIQDQHQPYDRSSKWLIQHHGDSMLWLARVKNIRAWRPAQAELVQPRRLPDGLLEVTTYPQRRVSQQMTDDLLLVYLDRGQLPEGVTLVLRPKGKYRVMWLKESSRSTTRRN